jgi:enoyl-CoA hydratase/carnithine racemase
VFSEGGAAADLAADAAGTATHADPTVAGILLAQESYTWLEEAPFVTIAAVRGYAFGAGLQLAMACDIRVVARGTQMGLLELQYGILPDLGGTQRLPRLVGPARAKQLILTRAKIDAEDAERIGLAEQVVSDEELEEVALELAETIAAQPPIAVRGVKRAIAAAMSGASVRDGLLVEAESQADCLRSDDMKEAITAFVEQRNPVYRGT